MTLTITMPDNQPRCKFCDGSKGLPIEANDDFTCKACGSLITNRELSNPDFKMPSLFVDGHKPMTYSSVAVPDEAGE